MRELLFRILDIGCDPGEESDLQVRKRTAVASALILMGVAIGLALVDIVIGQPAQAALALVQVVLFGSALLIFRRSHRLAPLFWTMAIVGTAVLLLSLIPGGGLSRAGTNLIWIILVPLGGVLFLGARASAPALAIVFVAVIAAVAINMFVPASQSPTAGPLFISLNILGPAIVALGLVMFIDGERVRAKAESDALLLNVLPRSIAERLKRGETVIADQYDEVTVLFVDIVGFTPFAAEKSPADVVRLLSEIFSSFDSLAGRHGLEKIKTIGDAYMVVAGAPEPRADHARAILEMALEMHAQMETTNGPAGGSALQLRTGIASGPAVAGVIGHRKFSYDVWGDAVNLASRMESTGLPGQIQVAESTWQECRDDYPFIPRDVEVKGKGMLRTYVLDPNAAE